MPLVTRYLIKVTLPTFSMSDYSTISLINVTLFFFEIKRLVITKKNEIQSNPDNSNRGNRKRFQLSGVRVTGS